MISSRGGEGLGQNSVISTLLDCYSHGLTTAVVAGARPAQDQTSKHSHMEWEGVHEPTPN